LQDGFVGQWIAEGVLQEGVEQAAHDDGEEAFQVAGDQDPVEGQGLADGIEDGETVARLVTHQEAKRGGELRLRGCGWERRRCSMVKMPNESSIVVWCNVRLPGHTRTPLSADSAGREIGIDRHVHGRDRPWPMTRGPAGDLETDDIDLTPEGQTVVDHVTLRRRAESTDVVARMPIGNATPSSPSSPSSAPSPPRAANLRPPHPYLSAGPDPHLPIHGRARHRLYHGSASLYAKARIQRFG
jgi:hypothetical protein